MKNYMIKTSFILLFVENFCNTCYTCLFYIVWLRTSSIPAVINPLRINTGNELDNLGN